MPADHAPDEADDAVDMIGDGEMPLPRYTLIHRDARLTDEEADRLVAALEAMDGGGDRDDDGGGEERDDDDSSGPGG